MKFFVLGTHRELSIAEIEAVTGVHAFASKSGDLLLLETDLPSAHLQDRLAGTVKVGSVVGELREWDVDAGADLIVMMMGAEENSKIQDIKTIFGVSVYDAGDAKRTKELRGISQRLGLEVKKRLKAGGHAARLVTSKEKTLSAVVVTTNKLLERGGEFVLIVTPKQIYIGQTEAVQDFESWGERDFGRPARDAKSGMLPPKLARMMVNLTEADPSKSTLLDPFCGSGTVPMEAMLLGFKRVIASDISDKAVADTRKNLEWVQKKFIGTLVPSSLDATKVAGNVTLILSPAQELDQHVKESVDAIVTETYLGPALHGGEHPDFLKKNILSLSVMYRDAFATLHKLLRPGGVAVVAFPVFRTKDGYQEVATRPMMEALGYNVLDILFYDRAGQHVGREIMVMRKEKS